MAKAKMYSNYVELVGNVASVKDANKIGDVRFRLAVHHRFTKKDGTKGEETHFIPVLVRSNRRYAKQGDVTVGKFLRVIGHLEDNTYEVKDENGNSFEPKQFKGGIEVNADKISIITKRADGQVESAETGEPIEVIDETEISEG